MRFKGTPGLHVIDTDTGREIGVFDGKGYMEVEDKKTAARMARAFRKAPKKQAAGAVKTTAAEKTAAGKDKEVRKK